MKIIKEEIDRINKKRGKSNVLYAIIKIIYYFCTRKI